MRRAIEWIRKEPALALIIACVISVFFLGVCGVAAIWVHPEQLKDVR